MSISPRLTVEYLRSLKAKQLQQLAVSIGARSSGIKDVLANEVYGALRSPKIVDAGLRTREVRPQHSSTTHRVLSLDMGILNLAYCKLDLPQTWSDPLGSAEHSSSTMLKNSLPALHEWTRMAVTKELPGAPSEQLAGQALPKDLFHPRVLAESANRLVQHLVLDPPSAEQPPDTILIERQRFRTMGAATVQEWTLRVNMFEGMLWAVLQAAIARGDWAGSVYSVMPATTARWWDGSSAELEPRKSPANSSKLIKQRRIERVEKWLRGDVLRIGESAEATTEAYLEQLGSRKAKATADRMEGPKKRLGKLDDLADCLLQAIAWIRWEQNRRAIVRNGVDAFHHLTGDSEKRVEGETALQRVLRSMGPPP